MTRAVVPLVLFLALAGLFWFVLGKMNEGEYNPRDVPTQFIGRSAPEFSLPDLLDPTQTVRPSDMAGKVWLLNVWGTWCPECWKEHEYLVYLARREGVPIVGINWRDDAADAKAMIERLGNPFLKIAFDPSSNAAIDWGVYGAPETFLIDAGGVVREKHTGAITPQVWKEKFSRYFAAARSAS
ncbi:MAG: DsbE family thiol:disulfide interchange protein [Chromatiaceae bacterium]|nr:DsbE family thiol:disulfide interchange protein [Gammaproteobacteria bacterium]MCP5318047.1 DsbE family thiol:disulfide interchange protein [Chromatiaceae bacterium]MCW5584732.1 DsbE family thiol:disulfide interchange protein [Chromatiales bacterium]MCB1817559.1 DsbE family thiol:disulfide interchange protein [Gammaproteobacteria bacterium]MCP5415120.1 DsbE family thiol:disulfide interchange protein [Chromatiaceae bacterium]